MSTTVTTATNIATLDEVDQYRHHCAEVAFDAVDSGMWYDSAAKEALAEIGVQVQVAWTERTDRSDGAADCGEDHCTICRKRVVTVATLARLEPGTTVDTLKRRVFEVVARAQQEHDWCGGGTVRALARLGIDAEYDPDDDDKIALA